MRKQEADFMVNFLKENIARHEADIKRFKETDNVFGAGMAEGMLIAREMDLRMLRACMETSAICSDKADDATGQ